MKAAYALRYKVVFLCLHPKRPKMLYKTAAKYMKKSKTFVSKWVKRYSDVKDINDLPDRAKNDEKGGQTDFTGVWEESSFIIGRQAVLRKKSLNILCDTIRRRLLVHEAKFRNTVKKLLLTKKIRQKKIHLSERNFGLRFKQGNFFGRKFFFWHIFPFIIYQ